jgi:hypothetical protein
VRARTRFCFGLGQRRAAARRAAFATALAFALAGLPSAGAGAAQSRAEAADGRASCFWFPVFDREQNFAYPDFSARYWAARFRLPPGSRLRLEGRFPRARYMSLNAYRGAEPTDTVTDTEIDPLHGDTNPFVRGSRRDIGRRARRWNLRVRDRSVPDDPTARRPNILYAASSGGVQTVVYRVYVPDEGRGIKAGGGLPLPVVIGADGTRLEGSSACREINDADRSLAAPTIPLPLYESLINTPGADPATVPAFNPFRWEAFFNLAYALSVFKVGTPSEPERAAISTEQTGGVYSNGDSRYVSGAVGKSYGEVLVAEGKMPTFPRTGDGPRRMPGGQLRYWSLCQNDTPLTTAAIDCVYDEQVPLARGRRYTIVVSSKAGRPATARRSCGVKFLRRGNLSDPFGRTGGGLLVLRNMRPEPSFAEAIQNVDEPGREKQVVGPYLPRMTYMGGDEFVAPGCPDGGAARG